MDPKSIASANSAIPAGLILPRRILKKKNRPCGISILYNPVRILSMVRQKREQQNFERIDGQKELAVEHVVGMDKQRERRWRENRITSL